MTINELRSQRAALVKRSRDFLETRATEDARLTSEDDAMYARMEDDLASYDKQIERLERLEKREAELDKPVNTPLTSKPEVNKTDEKTGRAADVYKKAFWAQLRKTTAVTPELKNALQEGTDSEGGYLVPDEFVRPYRAMFIAA